jgi:SH3 domain-containing YSC84-like protein 1
MKRVMYACPVLTMVLLLASFAYGQETREKQIERVQGAADALNEIMSAPDSAIPEEIIGSAKCVAVVPSLIKGGFVIGAARGKGVASCRTAAGWSAPAFFTVTGGSFGFQIGGQAVDLVMLVMNDNGMRSLLSSKFKLGADASVAAGPIGRHVEGATDWVLRAEVLMYSRARGVFAGATLNGSVVAQGRDDTFAFYGRMVPHRVILTGGVPAPQGSKPYLDTLARYSPVQPPPARATATQVPTPGGGR